MASTDIDPEGTSALPVVLSVDDEANVVKSIKRTLRKVDAKVLTATSGEEALSILEREPIDVIISDMRMPGMSGAELLREARHAQPKCTRILLTGYSDVEATMQAVNEGGIARYLSKPWNDDELRAIVEDAIRMASLEQENQQLQATVDAHTAELEAEVARRTEELEAANAMLTEAIDDLAQSYETMVELLANLSAMPNPEPETSQKKADLALAMAEDIKMDDEEKLTLRHAVRLHRIGWSALPSKLTATPRREQTQTQRAQFEQHPLYAQALLMSVPKLAGVAKILRAQHEHYNGDGFPDRARTEGIPISARILAIARDYYDYQRGRIEGTKLSSGNAVEKIRAGSGKEYDPDLIRVFSAVLPKLEKVEAAVSEICVHARALQPGMTLSRDLTTAHGALLLTKGAVLDQHLIENIINLEHRSDTNLSVCIHQQPERKK